MVDHDPRVLDAMWSMHQDRVTAEIGAALAAASLPVIVLKGPTFARWLYQRGEVREYGDSDLLVPRARYREARRILVACGFRCESTAPHSETWRRAADGAYVDLHHTLGAVARSIPVWEALARNAEPFEVGGTELLGLSEPARCLHAALHAYASGGQARPEEDLRRAIAVADRRSWVAAAELAERFACRGQLAAGLVAAPAGAALAEELGLAPELQPGAGGSLAGLAMSRNGAERGFGLFVSQPTLRDKVEGLARSLMPSPTWLRARYRWAGGWRLPAAYLYRLLSGPPTFLLGAWRWRRSRRALR